MSRKIDNKIDKLYSVPEVETVRGIPQRHTRFLIAKRKVAVVHIGRRVFVPESEIDRIVNEGYRPAGGDAA